MSTTSLRVILQGIYDERGELTPALVVDLARDPEHPLHHRFEWDDGKAAEAWRIEQGATLIRSVRVVFKAGDGPTDLRAYTLDRRADTPQSRYIPTEDALADPILRELTLRDMEREWRSLKRRYEHMAEFAAMVRRDIQGEDGAA